MKNGKRKERSVYGREWIENPSQRKKIAITVSGLWDIAETDGRSIDRIHIDGNTYIYGTPWSGKTPCYRNESLPLKAVVRLSQAPYNKITRFAPLQAFASLMPSCSCMRWDSPSVSALHKTVEKVIGVVPGYGLECLPDKAAADLCHSTVTK